MGDFFRGIGNVITGIGRIACSILKAACLAVALVVYGIYSLATEGINWATKQFKKFGSRFKKQTTIDPRISDNLKIFLDGQNITQGETIHMSKSVKDADTITRIAQDENGDVLAFEFVEVKNGCNFDGIVEQKIA